MPKRKKPPRPSKSSDPRWMPKADMLAWLMAMVGDDSPSSKRVLREARRETRKAAKH